MQPRPGSFAISLTRPETSLGANHVSGMDVDHDYEDFLPVVMCGKPNYHGFSEDFLFAGTLAENVI